jgi:peptide-methionine (S)-S-oxide reductase
VPLKMFFPGEDFHQNYCNRNGNSGYVQAVALPKLDKLKKQVPELEKK